MRRGTGGGGAAITIVLTIVTLLAFAGRATAQHRAPPPDRPTRAELERATALFDQSAIAYEERRWDIAIALLREAYSLSQEPLLLYNLGRAYEAAGDRASALDAYRRYLTTTSDGASADAARMHVLALEEATPEPAPAPAPIRAEPEPDRGRARHAEGGGSAAEGDAGLAPWLLAGGGAVVLVGGAVLAGVAVERSDAAARAETLLDAMATYGDAESLAIAAYVSFAAGGALAAIGLAWGIGDVVSREPGRERHELEVAVAPGGLVVRGTLE